eukprot:1236551-Amphidinium_carterae.1
MPRLVVLHERLEARGPAECSALLASTVDGAHAEGAPPGLVCCDAIFCRSAKEACKGPRRNPQRHFVC